MDSASAVKIESAFIESSETFLRREFTRILKKGKVITAPRKGDILTDEYGKGTNTTFIMRVLPKGIGITVKSESRRKKISLRMMVSKNNEILFNDVIDKDHDQKVEKVLMQEVQEMERILFKLSDRLR